MGNDDMYMADKKVRGQKRLLKNMLKEIEEIRPYRYIEYADKCQYEHYHIPAGFWINSSKTSSKVKTAFCKAWIRKTEEIIKAKPEVNHFCKVVGDLTVPSLWSSQITIFYDREYYDSFWNRHGAYQDWSRIKDGSSLARERNFVTDLKEIGVIETITDEDMTCVSEIWFYGELSEEYFKDKPDDTNRQ